MHTMTARSRFDHERLLQVAKLALRGIDPRAALGRPVLLAIEVAAIAATILFVASLLDGPQAIAAFVGQVALWLWLTLLAISIGVATLEARGVARARRLRALQRSLPAKSLVIPYDHHHDQLYEIVSSEELEIGDVVLVEAGDIIPVDGEVIDGVAEVDESAVTGESAPVIRESGGDRSAVIGGTRVLSDRLKVRVTTEVGHSFFEQMVDLVVTIRRRSTRAELWLTTPLLVGAALVVLAAASSNILGGNIGSLERLALLVALFAALLPAATAGLRSITGLAGMNALIDANIVAKSGQAIEAAARVDTLLLDKTGTITLGDRAVARIVPLPGISERDAFEAAFYASLRDDTPEGRSIVDFARRGQSVEAATDQIARSQPFTADSRMSGVILTDGTDFHKGEPAALLRWLGIQAPTSLAALVEEVARSGGTPLAISRGREILGIVHLTDAMRPGMSERCAELRRLGVRTVMVTGDNPRTAATVAAEAGVDDYIAGATPQAKLDAVRAEQARGRRVGVCGDGTNDVPALAQADLGIALSHGSAAAREAGNMVDLSSDPMKLIEAIRASRRLTATRRTLTGFALGSDLAKFAILACLVFFGGQAQQQVALLAGVMFSLLVALPLLVVVMRLQRRSPVPVGHRSIVRGTAVHGAAGMLCAPIGIGLLQMAIAALGLV